MGNKRGVRRQCGGNGYIADRSPSIVDIGVGVAEVLRFSGVGGGGGSGDGKAWKAGSSVAGVDVNISAVAAGASPRRENMQADVIADVELSGARGDIDTLPVGVLVTIDAG